MSNFQTVPIKYYVIKNEYSGHQFIESNFDEADNILMEQRKRNEGIEFNMYALIDA